MGKPIEKMATVHLQVPIKDTEVLKRYFETRRSPTSLLAWLMARAESDKVTVIYASEADWCFKHGVKKQVCYPHPYDLPHEDDDDEGFIEGVLRRGE